MTTKHAHTPVTKVDAVIGSVDDYHHKCEAHTFTATGAEGCTAIAEWHVMLTGPGLLIIGDSYICGDHARAAYGSEHEEV